MTLYLILGLAGAGLIGAITIQSWRLSAAQEALGAEKVGKALALARVQALSVEKAAAEAALSERDAAHKAIRALSAQTRRQLKDVGQNDPASKDWLDRAVPDGIKRLLANRRSHGQPTTPDSPADTATTVPPSARGGGHPSGPGEAPAGIRR